jgi:A/G-specific adenine glycosylase
MVERHKGQVPRNVDELRALPGIGGYTARAVAAIAFGQPVAAVDTNVRRVVGRVTWGHAAVPSEVTLQAAADALVDPARSADWTHAVMDIGATICRPRNAACGVCPLSGTCRFAVERLAGGNATVLAAAVPARTIRARSVGAQRAAAVPFPRTARWLRGRIVDRLREAEPGDWVVISAPVGDHGMESVRAALDALATEGLLERGELGRVRLPMNAGAPA